MFRGISVDQTCGAVPHLDVDIGKHMHAHTVFAMNKNFCFKMVLVHIQTKRRGEVGWGAGGAFLHKHILHFLTEHSDPIPHSLFPALISSNKHAMLLKFLASRGPWEMVMIGINNTHTHTLLPPTISLLALLHLCRPTVSHFFISVYLKLFFTYFTLILPIYLGKTVRPPAFWISLFSHLSSYFLSILFSCPDVDKLIIFPPLHASRPIFLQGVHLRIEQTA